MPLADEVQLLVTRLERIQEIFGGALQLYSAMTEDARQQLTTGLNKAYGQAEAFQVEFETLRKAERKGRDVKTQIYGDVTIGKEADPFSKTVENKSVTTAAKGDVDKQIKKAIQQLAGLTNHHPREGDVRVVDVRINNPYNPWPEPARKNPKSGNLWGCDDLLKDLLQTIKGHINGTAPGAEDLKSWLLGQEIVQGAMIVPLSELFLYGYEYKNSTRPIMVTPSWELIKVRCLTFKIHYTPGYQLRDGVYVRELLEAVIQCYKSPQGQQLEILTAKHKLV